MIIKRTRANALVLFDISVLYARYVLFLSSPVFAL